MIDHKQKNFSSNRRCKSSSDILEGGRYGNGNLLKEDISLESLELTHDKEGPRILRRAEKYRTAGKFSDESQPKISQSLGRDIFFYPTKDLVYGKGTAEVRYQKFNNCSSDDEHRRSSVVFVYSGPEHEAKKSFKQWSQKPMQNGTLNGSDKSETEKPAHSRVHKKTSIKVKERVAALLSNTPVLRRRKKGIDHSDTNVSGKRMTGGDIDMCYASSLPNVMKENSRPRSKSTEHWKPVATLRTLWDSDTNVKSKPRTCTESSETSSKSNSPRPKLRGRRSSSLIGLQNQVDYQLEDKCFSYNDINTRPRESKCSRLVEMNGVSFGEETDDDLSSAGSESSPNSNFQDYSDSYRKLSHNSEIITRHAPGLNPVNSAPELSTLVERKILPYSIRFQNIKIREIVDEELRIRLNGKTFDPLLTTAWCKALSSEIKERVEEITIGQYKIVVQIFIASLADDGLSSAAQCLYSQENDTFIVASFRGSELFALATVLAIDFRCEAEVDDKELDIKL